MAVRHGYGKIAGADALVFAYDTGDTRNSYKGEPTVNLAQTLSTFGTDGSGQAAVGTYTQVDGNNNHYRIVDVASNTRVSRTYSSFTAGASYTFSVEFRKLTGTPTLRFQLQGRNSGGAVNFVFPTTAQIGIVDVDGWQRATYTFTPGATSTTLYWFIQDGDDYTTYTHSYELRNPQLEQKSHATQFVNGTRSSIQGLLDLTGNSTINLANVSFDSNAQKFFDGTDDLAPITGLTISATQNKSYEAVIKIPSGYAQIGAIFAGRGNSTNMFGIYSDRTLRAGEDDQFINSISLIPVDVWCHVAYTFEFDGVTTSIQKLYINGQLDRQVTQTNYVDAYVESILYLGYDWRFAYYFNGNIDICKVYNRTLTAAEVRNNYNQYKGRFNL